MISDHSLLGSALLNIEPVEIADCIDKQCSWDGGSE